MSISDNRRCWDDLVPGHVHSEHYDVPGFLERRCSLNPLAVHLLPPLSGKRVLHLQCHFGMDTLSLANRGATVTGIDFSPAALHAAATLADALDISARFVEADVAHASEALHGETFDVVYASWGVMMWIEDLTNWARQIAALLRRGGSFHLLEVHPLIWSCLGSDKQLSLHGAYLGGEQQTEDIQGSYADPNLVIDHPRQHTWQHGLGEIVSALLGAGLHLEALREHEQAASQVLPMWVEREGLWVLPPGSPRLPLSFDLVARR